MITLGLPLRDRCQVGSADSKHAEKHRKTMLGSWLSSRIWPFPGDFKVCKSYLVRSKRAKPAAEDVVDRLLDGPPLPLLCVGCEEPYANGTGDDALAHRDVQSVVPQKDLGLKTYIEHLRAVRA